MSPLSFLIVLCGCLAVANANPGIVVRMNQGFFDFIYQELKPMLKQKIMAFPIPTVNYHVPVINTDLAFYELHLSSVEFNPASITPSAATHSLNADMNIYMGGGGAWVSRARWWPHIKSHGTLDFGFAPLKVQVGISMAPSPDGVWKFSMASLVVQSNFDVKFHGGILKGLDVGALRKYINSKAGEMVTSSIRSAITKGLATLTPYMKKYLPNVNWPSCAAHGLPAVCQDFALNLALTSSGIWRDRCYAELQFDGVVVYKDKPYFPGKSMPFPPIHAPCGDHGVSLLISQGTFTSAVDALFASGLVNLNIPSRKTANDTLLNQLIPGLYEHYANSSIYFNTTLLSSDFSLVPSKAITTIEFRTQVLARTSAPGVAPPTFKEIVDMGVKFTVGLTAHIAPTQTSAGGLNIVYMELLSPEVNNLTIARSTLPVDGPTIQKWLQNTILNAVETANHLLTKGVAVVPLTIHGAYLSAPVFLIGDHHLKIAVNLTKLIASSEEDKQAAEKMVFGDVPQHTAQNHTASVPNLMEELASTLTGVLVEGQEKLMNVFTKTISELLS